MADKMEMFMRAEDVDKWVIRNAFPESRTCLGRQGKFLPRIQNLSRKTMEIPSQNPEFVQEDKGNSFPECRSQSQGALNFQLQTIWVLQQVWMKFSGQEPSRRLPFHILCFPGTETSWWSAPPCTLHFPHLSKWMASWGGK